MKLSVAIMAHPARAEFVAELEELLPGARVVWDRCGDRWDTGRRSMLAYDDAADWHVVVQDDAILCDDFLPELRQGLRYVGAGPVALYMGRSSLGGRPTRMLVRSARRRRARWILGPGPKWGVGVAVKLKDIHPMLHYCDDLEEPENYDLRMQEYFLSINRPCWYAAPSLVDHRVGEENPSLVDGRGATKGRTARWFRRRPRPPQIGPWSPRTIDVPLRR